MLKRKAIRKIIITTFSIIILLVVCMIPSKFTTSDNYLNPSFDTIYVTNLGTNDIYLLGDNNYLIKTSIILNDENMEDRIKNIISYLTINKSSKIPNGLSGIIPSKAELLDIKIEDKIVYLNFSNELFNVSKDKERKLVESITYSLISIDGIEGVVIMVDSKQLDTLPQTKEKLPAVLNRNFGINKIYELTDFKNTQELTLYYVDNIDNTSYYVPVTKYINDDRDKIKIIVENLSSNYVYEPSLLSLLNPNTELTNYEIDNRQMNLNFNSSIFTNNEIKEEVVYQISQSVFSNYDVDKINITALEKSVEISKCCGIKNKNS